MSKLINYKERIGRVPKRVEEKQLEKEFLDFHPQISNFLIIFYSQRVHQCIIYHVLSCLMVFSFTSFFLKYIYIYKLIWLDIN